MAKRVLEDFDYRWGRLAEQIEGGARVGSALQAAAGAYVQGCRRDGGPTWGERAVLHRELARESRDELRRVLNGHNPSRRFPSPAEFRELLKNTTPLVGVRIEAGTGAVTAEPEIAADDGSANPVRVFLAEGVDRATAVEALRNIITALESRWEAVVGLGDGEFLSIEPGDLAPSAEPAIRALEAVDRAMDGVRAALGDRRPRWLRETTEAAVRRIAADFQNKKGNRRSAGVSKFGGKGRGKARAANH